MAQKNSFAPTTAIPLVLSGGVIAIGRTESREGREQEASLVFDLGEEGGTSGWPSLPFPSPFRPEVDTSN